MTKKQKFMYVFLIVITFGFILLYWKKYKQNSSKNYLSVEEKLNFDFEKFILYIGGFKNIKDVKSSQKVLTIFYIEKNNIILNELKNLKGILGISIKSDSISFVVGNSATYVKGIILKEIKYAKKY